MNRIAAIVYVMDNYVPQLSERVRSDVKLNREEILHLPDTLDMWRTLLRGTTLQYDSELIQVLDSELCDLEKRQKHHKYVATVTIGDSIVTFELY